MPHERLSDRELDVMLLLAAGRQVSEIATSLGADRLLMKPFARA